MSRPPVKAQRLASELVKRIDSGEWSPGMWLPSERELADEYKSARGTVRTALADLVQMGLLEAKTGAGVRVAERAAGEQIVLLDAAEIGDQLAAIRAELGEMNTRLDAIERRGEA
ncbi:MAG: GntR family transcriptional regulator [Nocardioides sp.]